MTTQPDDFDDSSREDLPFQQLVSLHRGIPTFHLGRDLPNSVLPEFLRSLQQTWRGQTRQIA